MRTKARNPYLSIYPILVGTNRISGFAKSAVQGHTRVCDCTGGRTTCGRRALSQESLHQEREPVDILQRDSRSAGDGPQRVFGDVERNAGLFVQPPVESLDQRAAAGNFLRRKGAAQPGNGTVGAEGYIYMENFAQLAGINVLLDEVNGIVKAVHHADIEHLARFMLYLLHLQGLGIGAGGRLLAEYMLSSPQKVHGDDGMHVVGYADGHGLDFGIVEEIVVIGYRGAAAIFLHSRFGPLGNDVAEILDLRLLIVHVGGNVRCVRNRAAADDGNFHFFHNMFRFSGIHS